MASPSLAARAPRTSFVAGSKTAEKLEAAIAGWHRKKKSGWTMVSSAQLKRVSFFGSD
jgi:hypothetical protein